MNLPISKAKNDLGEVTNLVRFGGERVVLSKHGQDVAAIVSLADLRMLQEMEDRADVAAALEACDEPRVSWDDVKRALNL